MANAAKTTGKYDPCKEYTARLKEIEGDVRRAEKKLERAQRLFRMASINWNSLGDQLEQAKLMKRRAARVERIVEEVITLHAYRDAVAEIVCRMEAERERCGL